MASSAACVEAVSCVPEDGFDDSEFEDYLESIGDLERARSHALTKCVSSLVGDALSMCQSIAGKSSHVMNVFTHDAKEDTSPVEYIETARSLLHRIHTDYNEIRNLVTGGATDAWYPASSTVPPEPSCLGMVMCLGPVMLTSMQMTCGTTANQVMMPSVPCNVVSTQVGNSLEVVQNVDAHEASNHSTNPVFERTPLRSAAALFQPTVNGGKEIMSSEAAPKTTLILRNIPTSLHRSAVMDVLRSEGFANHVVFIYLPMNLRSSGNFGYAFVDFDSTKVAGQCKDKLEGFTGWGEPTEQSLEVAWSETQGCLAHTQRYRDSPIMHESVEDELKPAMFKNGVRIPFPRPTKPIHAPRLRKNKS